MRILLAFLSFYFLVIASYTEFVNHTPWNFYNVYTLILLLITFLLTSVGLVRSKNEHDEQGIEFLSLKNLGLMGAVAFLWLLIRYDVFTYGLIWFDEATQYVPYWSLDVSTDSVNYAARQQQMPLDYYTSYAFLKLFGLSPEAMLFHSRVYGLLSCLVVFLVFLRLKLNWVIVLLGVTVFLSQATLLRYSGEARPIGLVLLLGLINFYNFNQSIKSPHRNFVYELLPSSLLLLLSTALQPALHILVLTLLFKLQSKNQMKSKMLESNFLLSNLLTLPLVWNIYKKTAGAVDNFKSQNIESTLMDLFTNLNLSHFTVFKDQMSHILLATIFLVLLAGTFKKLFFKGQQIFIHNWVYILLFPPFFVWVWSIMDWPLFPRYFAIWIAISIILIFQMLNELVMQYSKIFNKFVLCLIGVPVVLFAADYTKKQQFKQYEEKKLPDLRLLFEYEDQEVNSIYLNLPLMHPKDSGYYLDYTGSLYSAKRRYFWIESSKSFFHDKLKIIRPDLKPYYQHLEKFKFNENFDLFVLVYCGTHEVNPMCDFSSSELSIGGVEPIDKELSNNYRVLIYRGQNNMVQSMDKIFSIIEFKMGESPWIFEYYVSKVRWLMYIKNYSLARKYIDRIDVFLHNEAFKSYFKRNLILERHQKYLKTMESEGY